MAILYVKKHLSASCIRLLVPQGLVVLWLVDWLMENLGRFGTKSYGMHVLRRLHACTACVFVAVEVG